MRALQEEAKAIAQKNNGKIPDEQLKRLQDEFDKALHSQTECLSRRVSPRLLSLVREIIVVIMR